MSGDGRVDDKMASEIMERIPRKANHKFVKGFFESVATALKDNGMVILSELIMSAHYDVLMRQPFHTTDLGIPGGEKQDH